MNRKAHGYAFPDAVAQPGYVLTWANFDEFEKSRTADFTSNKASVLPFHGHEACRIDA
jgi:hypothetical protein